MLSIPEARDRLRGRIRRTPLVPSTWLSTVCEADVWLKLESLQETRAFKLRGAMNAILARLERGPVSGVVTASAGNHGCALAEASRQARIPCTVFVPREAPRTKIDAIRAAGATLDETARGYDEAESAARAHAAERGDVFVSAYNDADVIAGAGTIGLEILDDGPAVDTVLVPVGGGGLVSGIALAVKEHAPRCRVIGVEASQNPAFITARARGTITAIVPGPTLADGLSGNLEPGAMTFPIVQRSVDDLVQVSEAEIAAAICDLASRECLVVEGAGAVGVAALSCAVVDVRRRRVAVVISGGNIDPATLARLLAS